MSLASIQRPTVSGARALRGLAAVWILLAAQAPIPAAAADTPADALTVTRQLEDMVADHPREALARATAWEREAGANGDKPLLLRALRLTAMAHAQVEDNPRLRAVIERGIALAKELRDLDSQAELMLARADLAHSDGRLTEAADLYAAALEFTERHTLPDQRYRIMMSRASFYSAIGRRTDAMKLLTEAEAYFLKQGAAANRNILSTVYSIMANALSADPRDLPGQQRSIEYDKKAMALLDAKSTRYDLSTNLYNLGVSHLRLKEYRLARDYLNRSLAISRELGDPSSDAYIKFRLAMLDMFEGRPAAALPGFTAAIKVFEDFENVRMLASSNLGYADALSRVGQRREALNALTRARQFADKLNTPITDVQYYDTSSKILARFGDHAGAYHDAVKLYEAERKVHEESSAQLAPNTRTAPPSARRRPRTKPCAPSSANPKRVGWP